MGRRRALGVGLLLLIALAPGAALEAGEEASEVCPAGAEAGACAARQGDAGLGLLQHKTQTVDRAPAAETDELAVLQEELGDLEEELEDPTSRRRRRKGATRRRSGSTRRRKGSRRRRKGSSRRRKGSSGSSRRRKKSSGSDDKPAADDKPAEPKKPDAGPTVQFQLQGTSSGGKCLASQGMGQQLTYKPCDRADASQLWTKDGGIKNPSTGVCPVEGPVICWGVKQAQGGACGSTTLKPSGSEYLLSFPSGKCVFGGFSRARGHASQSYSAQLCEFIAGGKFKMIEG